MHLEFEIKVSRSDVYETVFASAAIFALIQYRLNGVVYSLI